MKMSSSQNRVLQRARSLSKLELHALSGAGIYHLWGIRHEINLGTGWGYDDDDLGQLDISTQNLLRVLGVGLSLSTIRQPVELSQLSPLRLRLELISSHLLLLLWLPDS